MVNVWVHVPAVIRSPGLGQYFLNCFTLYNRLVFTIAQHMRFFMVTFTLGAVAHPSRDVFVGHTESE